MATNSPVSITFALNTTPNDPFPTALRLVYDKSLFAPVLPSFAGTLYTLFGSTSMSLM